MTLLGWLAQAPLERMGIEFLRFVARRESQETHRSEAEWWREFFAYVAMRQNFPDVKPDSV